MLTQNIEIKVGKSQLVQAVGQGFHFESGVSTTADLYLSVRSEGGDEVLIKPGQQLRFAKPTGNWTIKANDPAAAIAGRIQIFNEGEGFIDSNTNNTFKLDGTFTNTVKVSNTQAESVPVKVGNTQAERVPVALDPSIPINTLGNVLSYTGSYFISVPISSTRPANVPVQIVAPAANVNGVVLLRYVLNEGNSAAAGFLTLLAKATPPASKYDGDVLVNLELSSGANTSIKSNLTDEGMLKIPAGKGIYLFPTTTVGSQFENIFYQVL